MNIPTVPAKSSANTVGSMRAETSAGGIGGPSAGLGGEGMSAWFWRAIKGAMVWKRVSYRVHRLTI